MYCTVYIALQSEFYNIMGFLTWLGFGSGRKLTDKVVLVTGASSGIGKELAVVLHREGARVVIAARRGEVLDQLKEELIVAGGENRAKVVTLDLSSLDSLEGKAEEIIQVVKVLFGSHTCFFLQMYGQLDVLINCGGVSVRGGAVETLLEVHKRVMDTNYFGTKSQSW